jgi:hypothetical protein
VMVGVNKFRNDETSLSNNDKIDAPNSDLGFELLRDLRLSSVFEK